jgi:hypothetical protein
MKTKTVNRTGKKLVKKALEDGMSASDAFQKFGIM